MNTALKRAVFLLEVGLMKWLLKFLRRMAPCNEFQPRNRQERRQGRVL